jgi:hypothetical protein
MANECRTGAEQGAGFERLPEEAQTVSGTASPDVFVSMGDVLRYLQENKGRQIKKSKLYEDVKTGLLRKKDGKYRRIDVDRYAGSLSLSTTPDGRVNAAEERQRRREDAEIRIQEARAAREERKHAILMGEYVSRKQVDQELAARAVVLNQGIKSRVEASALDLVNKVGGKPKHARLLVQEMEKILDAACNEYAQAMEFEVTLYALGDEEDDDADEAPSG